MPRRVGSCNLIGPLLGSASQPVELSSRRGDSSTFRVPDDTGYSRHLARQHLAGVGDGDVVAVLHVRAERVELQVEVAQPLAGTGMVRRTLHPRLQEIAPRRLGE